MCNYTIGNIVPGLWFGLIHYLCDNDKGTLVSKLDCKPCSMFCTYNELIPDCASYALPLTLSLIGGDQVVLEDSRLTCNENSVVSHNYDEIVVNGAYHATKNNTENNVQMYLGVSY